LGGKSTGNERRSQKDEGTLRKLFEGLALKNFPDNVNNQGEQ
jgi:hypothetical protein